MPNFPTVGCGAAAQYPSSFEIHAPAKIQRYVDGSEQRIRASRKSTLQWIVRLDHLPEGDAQKVADFFESVQGRASAFRFLDPWTNIWHEQCWFSSDSLVLEHVGDSKVRGELRIHTTEG